MEFSTQEQPQPLAQLKVPTQDEDVTIIDDSAHDAFTAYYAEVNKVNDRRAPLGALDNDAVSCLGK